MKRLPFRRRLIAWSALVVFIALAACGTGAAYFIHRRALAHLDTSLRDNLKHCFDELREHGGRNFDWKTVEFEMREWLPATTPAYFVEVRTEDGTMRFRSKDLPAGEMTKAGHRPRDAWVGGMAVRLIARTEQGTTIHLAAPRAEVDELASDLRRALLAGLPVALLFAWLGGRWLGGVAIAPVEEITAAAERISVAQSDQRVPVPPVRDEFQRLAVVLNDTFDRLQASYGQALRFSADASHELKTPLTILRLGIETVLTSPTLGGSDREAIGGLLEQTGRLTNITASLLLLARADAGRLMLDLTEQDICSGIAACVEDTCIVAEASDMRVACTLPPQARARVEAPRFAQVLGNLFDNAVKYNYAGGEIRIALTRDGAFWNLSVANTGPGLTPEQTPNLFQRFYRPDHVTDVPGTGLGLSLARELARAHGGDVKLVSSDAEWTVFAVTLPAA